ncbi:D-amino-acid dehydrogenase [Sinobacterium caligoides]|uniref:D-amino-acid dehydrogenase n=1 Tax=Sinobacterium caligoides TaxID=933926 RepID=A0A3N2E083_9GAMM|nr:FAD-dependent oxidoreductase [Sinobacterium caligoides]ROS05510.1 D-amino-acid dehydrogenase [Sinobacterium caligoides]
MSVIIVGGGIVGLSAAFFLARQGEDVTVVDPAPAYGCSYGNGGVIATDHLHPMINRALLKHLPRLLFGDYPALWVPPKHMPHTMPWLLKLYNCMGPKQCSEIKKIMTDLAMRAESAWSYIDEFVADAKLLRKQGRYYAYLSEASFASDNGIWADRSLQNIDFRFHDGKDFPFLQHQKLLYQVAQIDDIYYVPSPVKLLNKFHQSLNSLGVKFIYQKVKNVTSEGSQAKVVLDDDRVLSANNVALCAGVANHQLIKPLGLTIPLVSETGYAISFKTQTPVVDKHTLIKDRHLSISPTDEGFRITGVVQLESPVNARENSPSEEIFSYMRQALGGLIDLSKVEEIECWTGNRPSLPDGLPMIGSIPKHQNILVATGHQHIGMTLGPVTGQLVTDLITSNSPTVDMTPFSTTRFR